MVRPAALVRFSVLVVGVVYSAVLVLAGVSLDSTFKVLLGFLPAAASGLLFIWDAIAWRMPLLHNLTHRPRIDGLWEVVLRPTAESHIPVGGNRGPITAYMVIRQSYWSLHIRQLTAESGSDSRSFFWERPFGGDVERLVFLYQNDPRAEHRTRSPRHLGTCALETASLTPAAIQGSYFTDRYTQGEMHLSSSIAVGAISHLLRPRGARLLLGAPRSSSENADGKDRGECDVDVALSEIDQLGQSEPEM